jgi:hypothetical protein
MAGCNKGPDSKALFRPGCFAIVMATGIISLSCHSADLDTIARALFWLTCGLYSSSWFAW